MTNDSRRLQVGPFNRVEGDLDIALDIADGQVQAARVNSTLYRGFEQMLVGKPALDALVYTPRICGICSVSQSVACARALADAGGIRMTANGERSHNLLLANESLTDLLTHFYLFFMPDFARHQYQNQPWFEAVSQRFTAVKGQATRQVLPARSGFLHLMGLMAGHWPHTLSVQPGGSSKPVTRPERLRLLAILADFRRFLETTLFGDDLDVINRISTLAELEQWRHQQHWQHSDLRTFLHLSEQLQLQSLGRGSDRFMSFGNFPHQHQPLVARGVWTPEQGITSLDARQIEEDLSHAWLDDPFRAPRHPAMGITEVSLAATEKERAYSWCKAPRLGGQVMETGALARAVVSGRPLLQALVQAQGGSVHSRVLARLLELAWLLPEMQRWATDLSANDPFCEHSALARDGEGSGMIEAARGALGHWLRLKNGRISHYQIIAPTTWNFSPRDTSGQPGALEQALVGTPVSPGESDPVAVQHIVRSFDPCMVCTVH